MLPRGLLAATRRGGVQYPPLKLSFVKQGVLIPLGGGGTWDRGTVARPQLVEMNSSLGRWHLYYTGSVNNDDNGPTSTTKIGFAYSNDGITWTKYASNPLANLTQISDFKVLVDGSVKRAYFTLPAFDIGYREAQDADGTNWGTSSAGAPPGYSTVLARGASGTWDDNQIRYPSVIKRGAGDYLMYYMGHDGSTWRLGLATSPDGTTWTKYARNPIFSPIPSHSWESNHVFDPHVLIWGNRIYLGYTGNSPTHPVLSGNSFYEQLCMAYSAKSDGVTFVRNGSNPLIPWGGSGSDDEDSTIDFNVLLIGSTLYAYYTGRNSGRTMRILYATAAQ